ncbi:DUF1127 domain-containing protein [Methylobacterium nigriterrae]|uniref:DUF1127 domain-containing protein n=1 Tax=Methylobacterium nigriterrae TaxID=3127512 RepID=UPI0030135063
MIRITDRAAPIGHPRGFAFEGRTMLAPMIHVFQSWRQRRTAHRELAALDDRLLEDIGLNRYELTERRALFW